VAPQDLPVDSQVLWIKKYLFMISPAGQAAKARIPRLEPAKAIRRQALLHT